MRRLTGLLLLFLVLLLVGCESVWKNMPTSPEGAETEAWASIEETPPEAEPVTTEVATEAESIAKAPEFPFAPETDRSGIYCSTSHFLL